MCNVHDCFSKILHCPIAILNIIVGISVIALASALTAELYFGLEPCVLCLYQRIPFVLAIIFGITGMVMRKNRAAVFTVVTLSGLAFLTNAGIALYHSGIERKWWSSAVEGCAVPNMGDTQQSLLQNILSAPSARCDEIPWADPIFGLSMANYNVALGFGMFIICGLSLFFMTRPSSS